MTKIDIEDMHTTADHGNKFAKFYMEQFLEDLGIKCRKMWEEEGETASATFYYSAMGYCILKSAKSVAEKDIDVLVDVYVEIFEKLLNSKNIRNALVLRMLER